MLWLPGTGMLFRRSSPAGWRVLVDAGCVLKLPRLWELAAVGSFQGRPVYFVSVQFALLGVIADSEYVDCMGNNRQSTLYGTPADLDRNRWIHCT